jgi:hypothetical protein
MLKTVIKLDQTPNLQEAVENLWAGGFREFELSGVYKANEDAYALLRIRQHLSGIAFRALDGGATLDGAGRTSHIVVVEQANATFDGIKLTDGDTTNPTRVAKDYAGEALRSVYEAIDGAGVLVLGDFKRKI